MTVIKEIARSLFFGVTLPFQSAILILTRKKLLFLSILPLAMSITISVWGTSALKGYAVQWGTHWLAQHGYGEGTLTVSAALFLINLIVWILAAISFSFLAGILASPFNDALAENTEKHTAPQIPLLPEESRTWAHQWKCIRIDILKTGMVTSLQIFLIFSGLLLFWVPGLNIALGLTTFWLMTFQFISYPQTRRGEGLLRSFLFLLQHPFASLGFGVAVGTLFAIPMISAFTLPTAVVGGTLLYARSKDPTHRLR